MAFDHQAVAERMAASFNRNDFSIIDELYTEDCVDEYPQSGEVARGRANLRAILEHIPGEVGERGPEPETVRGVGSDEHRIIARLFTVVKVQGRGDAGTITLRSRYHDGTLWWVIIVYELRNDRIAHSITFFAQAFEPQPWRAAYVELT